MPAGRPLTGAELDMEDLFAWLARRIAVVDGHWLGPEKFAGIATHRLLFALTYGELPPRTVVGRRCGNDRCCRPSHLKARSVRDVLLEAPTTLASINAAKVHCPRGHPLDGGTVGHRTCRTCARERSRRRHRQQTCAS